MKKKSILSNNPIEEFPAYLKRHNQSDNTITAYETSIRYFYALYQEMTPINLKAFRSFLIKNYRPATINQRIHAMNVYLQFLEDCYPDRYPELYAYRLNSIKVPRTSYRDTVISNEDCQILQDYLKANDYDLWYFVVRFLVTTGARVSELVQIKVEHLNCGYLDLYSKGGKMRRIYITDTLCEEALHWCQNHGRVSGFLFMGKDGRPITTRAIHSQLKVFAERCSIDPDTVYPHSFRHRFAKNFLSRNSDIALLADILGHESIETTRIYLTKTRKEQQELLDEIVTW